MYMNKVTKDGAGLYQVTDRHGKPLGSFQFRRWKSAGKAKAECIVRPVGSNAFKAHYCYFAGAKQAARTGEMFGQSS